MLLVRACWLSADDDQLCPVILSTEQMPISAPVRVRNTDYTLLNDLICFDPLGDQIQTTVVNPP